MCIIRKVQIGFMECHLRSKGFIEQVQPKTEVSKILAGIQKKPLYSVPYKDVVSGYVVSRPVLISLSSSSVISEISEKSNAELDESFGR